MDLSKIISISNEYGNDPELVLAGGGNTSVKDNNVLYVKCSGTSLKTIDENGFVPVSIAALKATMTKDYPEEDKSREAAFLEDVMASRVISGESRRPSVEALLHSLFPQKYVVHLHPALVNGLTCVKNSEQKTRDLFSDKAIWIPATRPGYMLGKLCYEIMEKYRMEKGRDVNLAFLENHGIFTAADTIEEIKEIFNEAMAVLKSNVKKFPDIRYAEYVSSQIGDAVEKYTSAEHVRLYTSPQLLKYLISENAVADIMLPLTPDHIVYYGAKPLYIQNISQLQDRYNGEKIILIKNAGMFAVGKTEKEAELAALLFLDAVKVVFYTKSFGKIKPLSDELVNFILNWEAEHYRQKEANS